MCVCIVVLSFWLTIKCVPFFGYIYKKNKKSYIYKKIKIINRTRYDCRFVMVKFINNHLGGILVLQMRSLITELSLMRIE